MPSDRDDRHAANRPLPEPRHEASEHGHAGQSDAMDPTAPRPGPIERLKETAHESATEGGARGE